jgi:hypothetical protein
MAMGTAEAMAKDVTKAAGVSEVLHWTSAISLGWRGLAQTWA